MPATAIDAIDGLTTSVAVKAPCRTYSATNITLAGLQTFQGITLTEGDRHLCTGQTNPIENGIYKASTGTWVRAADFDGNRDAVRGTLVPVNTGGGAALFELTSANPVTIGTSALTFSLRYGANVRYDATLAELAAQVPIVNDSERPGAIRRYGAAVDGVTDDTAAWQAAVDQCALGGGVVRHDVGTSMATTINCWAGVEISMGSQAILMQFADRPNFTRLLTFSGTHLYDGAVDSAPFIIRGGILDGNRANCTVVQEHNHLLALFGAITQPGRLRVILDGVVFRECVSDGVLVGQNVNLTWSNLFFWNCRRSGMSIVQGTTKVRGSNMSAGGTATMPGGVLYGSDFDIEILGVGHGGSFAVDIECSNMDLHGSLDVAVFGGSNSNVTLSNVVMHGARAFGGFCGETNRLKFVNCSLILNNGSEMVCPVDVNFLNCDFTFSNTEAAAVGSQYDFSLQWQSSSTLTGQRIKFSHCRFKADSTIDPSDIVYGIASVTEAAANDNLCIVDHTIFDSSLQVAVSFSAGGKLVLSDVEVNCAKFLRIGSSSTRYFDCTVSNPRFGAGMTTYAEIFNGDANNVMRHVDTRIDEAHANLLTGAGNPNLNTHVGWREIFVASAPTAALDGFKGDRAIIKAPSAGNPVEYVCTTANTAGSAVWKLLTTAAA